MPRKARRRQPAPLADYGPHAQHARGRLEIVDAANPEAPSRTLRRARVVVHYTNAHAQGYLSYPEWKACDRYVDLCEREKGATPGPQAGRVDPWSRTPALRQMQATAQLTRVHAALGGDATALLRLYVRDNLPTPELARRRGENPEVTVGRVRAAIRRLAEHWGMM